MRSAPATAAPIATEQRAALEALDAAVIDVRRVGRRPGYRTRLFRAIGRDIDTSTVRVLRAVERGEETGDDVCVGDIADRLQVDPSTASRLVRLQVVAGYLQRSRGTIDRRRTTLSLTTDGRKILDEVTAARRSLLAEVTHDWTTEEVRVLAHALGRLTTGFATLEGASARDAQ